MNKAVGVFGYKGFGKQVMQLVLQQIKKQTMDVYFVDDDPVHDNLGGIEILRFDEFVGLEHSEKYYIVAVANAAQRRSLTKRCEASGFISFDVIAESALVMDGSQRGAGVVVCPFSMISTNLVIGKSFHLNIYSYVAHDCVIGDYVTFAPGVKCNGNVHIEDDVYIGTGAIIKQGTLDRPLRIGKGAVVGMGAVVTKDVPPGVTVVGNPAKPLVKA